MAICVANALDRSSPDFCSCNIGIHAIDRQDAMIARMTGIFSGPGDQAALSFGLVSVSAMSSVFILLPT